MLSERRYTEPLPLAQRKTFHQELLLTSADYDGLNDYFHLVLMNLFGKLSNQKFRDNPGFKLMIATLATAKTETLTIMMRHISEEIFQNPHISEEHKQILTDQLKASPRSVMPKDMRNAHARFLSFISEQECRGNLSSLSFMRIVKSNPSLRLEPIFPA
jgi:hypothetical protein